MTRRIWLSAVLLGLCVAFSRAEYADKEAKEKGPVKADKELPAEVRTMLEKAQEFQLISLDPAPPINPKDKTAKDKGKFHDWRVLGQTTIKDADIRKKVLDAVFKGIQEGEGDPPGCFQPRHGLHLVHDNKPVDVLICFECMQIQVYVDGKRKADVLTGRSPQAALDAILKEAKVPLPPKPGE